MKYRFRVSEKPSSHLPAPCLQGRVFRLKGHRTLRRLPKPINEPIEIKDLFEIAALPEPPKKQKEASFEKLKAWLRRLWNRIEAAATGTRSVTLLVFERIRTVVRALALRARRKPKPKTIHSLPVIAGFLCATLLVSLCSAGGVFLGLFGAYNRAYTGVVIPNFVGQSAALILQEEHAHFNLMIEYETNPDVPAGEVITQSPRAGVTRRLYGKDGYCNIHLTVSRSDEPYQLEDLVGMSRRDALLTLRNHNVSATVTEVYSETAPKGSVLETIPPSGSTLADGAQVLLRISAGTKQSVISVPNLFGMTETEANALLRKTGLRVGEVSYVSSTFAAGTIVTQDLAAYSSVSEGVAVSYTVSIGERYWLPTVPDLYGMSLTEAEQTLRESGLLIGTVHPIQGAAPKGTVITQSPRAGTPITSATVSVSLYVTS